MADLVIARDRPEVLFISLIYIAVVTFASAMTRKNYIKPLILALKNRNVYKNNTQTYIK